MQVLWRTLARVQRLDSLYLLAGQPLFIPFYHTVCDDHLPHVRPLYPYKGVMQFEQDLEALLAYFSPISLLELYRHMRLGERLPERPMLLTFDDGMQACATIIAPMLARKGIPASFFINPAFLDNQALMYRHQAGVLLDKLLAQPQLRQTATHCLRDMGWGAMPPELAIKEMRYDQQPQLAQLAQALEIDFEVYLETHKPYMSWAQVETLAQQGFDFGAHSLDHPRFQGLTRAEQVRQVRESVDIVQERLQLPYRAFAFPFSDARLPRSLMHTLVRGPEPIADITFGTSGIRRDVHARCLQRVDLETPAHDVNVTVKTLLFKFMVRKLLRSTRIRRRA